MTNPQSAKDRAWLDAQSRHHLSDAHVRMARALGMNPKKLGKLDNHRAEPWKAPLPEFIKRCYEKRFGHPQPTEITVPAPRVATNRDARRAAKAERRRRQEAETAERGFFIRDLSEGDRRPAAKLLADLLPHGWPTINDATREVGDALRRRIRLAAIEGRDLIGWIGGRDVYPGRVVALHPLVVRRDRQRRGVGGALLAEFEVRVRQTGAGTVFVGCGDVSEQTTLAGVDLYPDVLDHVGALRNLAGHAFEFFTRSGYTVVGAFPDAHGFGRPDILLAKRVVPKLTGDLPPRVGSS